MMLNASSSNSYSLLIDTAYTARIGLFYEDSFLEWVEINDEKPSAVFHFRLYEILHKYNLTLRGVDLFWAAGPGSYTGMRLSQGLMDLLKIEGIKVYSFYHYEIPFLAGIHEGSWMTNAFKNEVFVYSWKNEEKSKKMVLKKDLVLEGLVFGEAMSDFDYIPSYQTLKENFKKISSQLLQRNTMQDIFYFRPIELEFPIMTSTKK